MEQGHFPTQEYLPSRRIDNTQCQSIHNPPIAVHNMAIPELTWQGFFLHSSSLWPSSLLPPSQQLERFILPHPVEAASPSTHLLRRPSSIRPLFLHWRPNQLKSLVQQGTPNPNGLSTRAHHWAKLAQSNCQGQGYFPRGRQKSLKIQKCLFLKMTNEKKI